MLTQKPTGGQLERKGDFEVLSHKWDIYITPFLKAQGSVQTRVQRVSDLEVRRT